jgi:hypothetical protein
VYEDDTEDTSVGYSYYDTAYDNSRQLDYYRLQNVTSLNFSGAKKQYENAYFSVWLRTASSPSPTNYGFISPSGFEGGYFTFRTDGVSPAFRIA